MASGRQRRLLYEALLALENGGGPRDTRQRPMPARPGSNFQALRPVAPLRWSRGEEPASPPRRVLGISAFYHDAAAALVVDGVPVVAIQEERLSRTKNDRALPRRAVAACLRYAGLRIDEIDALAFYEEPFLKLDRLVRSAIALRPAIRALEDQGWFDAVERNLALSSCLAQELRFGGPVAFVQHHLSHAASAFLPSPFDLAACLVIDGVGEWATTTMAQCDGSRIELLVEVRFPHSLGLLYSMVTSYLGFAVNSDEYKVMALAAAGRPTFKRALAQVIEIFPDGSFCLDIDPYTLAPGAQCVDQEKLHTLLGFAPRPSGAVVTSDHHDLARSIQEVLEEAMTLLLGELHRRTGSDNLVMAGGVALNGVAVYKAFQASPFRDLYIQPAAGDAGGALGAALYVSRSSNSQATGWRTRFDPRLGPDFSQHEIESDFDRHGVSYQVLEESDLLARVAKALATGQVVGWFQGRMEFGPRALASRSILASPIEPEMQDILNRKIKLREDFRPFAPMLPEEDADDYFQCDQRYPPLYTMQMVVPVIETHRGRIPAAVHLDGTARPQLVSRDRDPLTHALLRAFERQAGVPVLINTSFNLAGDPIVCTPLEAYKTFRYSDLDLLVVGRCLCAKTGLTGA